MIDFNIFNNMSNNPIIQLEEDYVAQQIEMLFMTDKESVLGDIEYGTNYDRYVYGVGVSNTALENKILGDIRQLDLGSYEPSVKVTFLEGTLRDIALIDVTLKDDMGYGVFKKTFLIN